MLAELPDGAVIVEWAYKGTPYLVREVLKEAGDAAVLEPADAVGWVSRTTYQSGIRCGQPSWPWVAQMTVRCSRRKARASSPVMRI